MQEIDFQGGKVKVNSKGYLINGQEWRAEMMQILMERDGLESNEFRCWVIEFIRTYYVTYGIIPMVKIICKELGNKFGHDKGHTQYLDEELFPDGLDMAGKHAGLSEKESERLLWYGRGGGC